MKGENEGWREKDGGRGRWSEVEMKMGKPQRHRGEEREENRL
jgi:hypothetical protein